MEARGVAIDMRRGWRSTEDCTISRPCSPERLVASLVQLTHEPSSSFRLCCTAPFRYQRGSQTPPRKSCFWQGIHAPSKELCQLSAGLWLTVNMVSGLLMASLQHVQHELRAMQGALRNTRYSPQAAPLPPSGSLSHFV